MIIIGAQKSGTTSLLRYLGEHPQCVSHPHKEFSYFTDSKEYSQGIEKAFHKYFSYLKFNDGVKIVCKNAGLYTREIGLERLKTNNPDCELIFILRNPVDRAYSSYLMEKNVGAIDFEFDQLPGIIRKEGSSPENLNYGILIHYGKYIKHLVNIYKFFPQNQVSVFLFEDLESNANEVCKKIFEKIDVRSDFIPNVSIKHNVTVRNRSIQYAKLVRNLLRNDSLIKKMTNNFLSGPAAYQYGEILRWMNKTEKKHNPMSDETRKFLIDYFKPYNEQLEKVIARDLTAWNK